MMKPIKDNSVSARVMDAGLFGLAVLALTGGTGCLCPPCAGAPAASAPAASATGTDAAALSPATASAPVASGNREVIWDGDNVAKGQSWADCDKKGECKSTLAPAPGEGVDGTLGLKLHAEGAGWQGGGWNWFGWYPEDAGTDISGYDDLTFSVKLKGASKEATPAAAGISFAFGCSREKKTSADASLGKYAANATDGQWHDVSIPLKVFFDGKGAVCDARTAWEIRASSWSGTPVNFDLLLDNIAVAKK